MANSQQEFINAIGELIVKHYKAGYPLPSLSIAQACLETGYGKSAPQFNYFGIKGKGGTQTTWEVINGEKVIVEASFQGYASMEDSVIGHNDFLLNNGRYAKVLAAKDYKEAIAEIGKSGYATDPLYSNKLLGIAENFQLHKFDQIAIQKTSGDDTLDFKDFQWDMVEKLLGDYYNEGVIDTWDWVQQAKDKSLKASDLLFLDLVIAKRLYAKLEEEIQNLKNDCKKG